MNLRWLAAAAPLAALSLAFTVPAGVPAGVTPDRTAGSVAVTRTVLGCPPAVSADDATVAGLAPVVAPGADSGARDRSGRVTATAARGASRPLAARRGPLVDVGIAAPDRGDRTTGPVAVRGTNDAAAGLFAARVHDADGAIGVGPCAAPRGEWWFAGAGAGLDHRSVLRLSNVDKGPAVVDVAVVGGRSGAGVRGLTLAAGESVALPLVEVAPGPEELTVHVTTSRGRVVAAVSDSLRRRQGAAGQEWLPASTPPSRQVVLTGVADRRARRTLVVTNPDDRQALVSLELVTRDGTFAPRGLERLSVAPGRVRTVDLTEAVGSRPAAVGVRSSVPVVATVRSTLEGDHAYAVPTSSGADEADSSGLSVVVLAGDRTTIQLGAGAEPVSVRWTAYARDGRRTGGGTRSAAAGRFTEWPVPAGAAYLTLSTLAGDGWLAAVHTGPGVAVQGPARLPLTVLRPQVRPVVG